MVSIRSSDDSISAQSFDPIISNVRDPGDMPVEILARVESVLRVLKECKQQMEISMVLPLMFTNSDVVCRILEKNKYNECAKLLRECVKDLNRQKAPTKCRQNEMKIARVIDAFQNNHKIIEIIGHSFAEINYDEVCFLAALNTFYETARKRMFKDPRAELVQEKELHTIYWKNIEIAEYFEKFAGKTIRGKNSLRWRIAAKEAILLSIENEFVVDRNRRQIIYDLEEKEARKRFNEAQKLCQMKQKDVDEDVEKANESLVKTLKSNFITENDVRAEHNKLQIQLQTLVNRYDTVLLDRRKMSLLMDQKMKVAQEEFDEFFKYYSEKESIYNSIVTAHQLKKQREFEEKLRLFVGNRAAKIIQKAWKRFIKIVRKERAEEAKAKGKKK